MCLTLESICSLNHRAICIFNDLFDQLGSASPACITNIVRHQIVLYTSPLASFTVRVIQIMHFLVREKHTYKYAYDSQVPEGCHLLDCLLNDFNRVLLFWTLICKSCLRSSDSLLSAWKMLIDISFKMCFPLMLPSSSSARHYLQQIKNLYTSI